MKKRLVVSLLAAVMAVSMAACGGNSSNSDSATGGDTATETAAAESTTAAEEEWMSSPEAYLSGITASDYVDVPEDYDSLTVEVDPAEKVTDEDVETTIQNQLEYDETLEEVTDRTVVEDGDVVNIDYVGTMDGEEFDGGSAEDYDLTIGSGSFIDGFEEGLIGANVGDTVTLDLTFPDDYSDTTKAGEDVEFEVTINSIEEYVTPELTDEYVESLEITDDFGNAVSTVEDFRTYVRNYLVEESESTYTSDVQSAIMDALMDEATFKKDPPEAMIERYDSALTEQLTYQAALYGTDLETLMTLYGSTEDTYEQDIRDEAISQCEQLILLQAIADKEDLELSDDEFQEELEEAVSSSEAYTSVDEVENDEVQSYREYLMRQAVLDFLVEKTTIVSTASESGSTSSTSSTAAAAVEEDAE